MAERKGDILVINPNSNPAVTAGFDQALYDHVVAGRRATGRKGGNVDDGYDGVGVGGPIAVGREIIVSCL